MPNAVDNDDHFWLPLEGFLDTCAQHGDTWNLCSSCHTSLNGGMIPKFSAMSHVNITMCQNYPSALEDLTLTEEYIIAMCHPHGVVLKLRPNGRSSPVNYHALHGHFIVIPQEPVPLLEILPSPDLALHSLIKVFWFGARRPVDSDLNAFLFVRKARVLAALQYLVQHNHLYHDTTINYPMIDNWGYGYIPPELRDNIICIDEPDHHEHEEYTVNLRTGTYENDLQAARDNAPGSSDGPLSAAVREAAAAPNPVAVAEFFHHVCKAVLDGLFATNTSQIGILGNISNHFAVVETNGRGMLHLHGLAWARGNLAFTLRDRLLQDSDFAARMIRYLELIVAHGTYESILHDPEVNLTNMPSSAKGFDSDGDFHLRLAHDSNCVARKMQVHSRKHLATCFKYRQTGSRKNACRFGILCSMPRQKSRRTSLFPIFWIPLISLKALVG